MVINLNHGERYGRESLEFIDGVSDKLACHLIGKNVEFLWPGEQMATIQILAKAHGWEVVIH